MDPTTHLEPTLKSMGATLEGMQRQGEGDENPLEGTLGYLGGNARWLVFLARGCDELQVSVCEGLVGRELYDGLRRAGDSARAWLAFAGWPVPVTNRIAYGHAAALHGSRS